MTELPLSRQCTVCEIEKPLDEFYRCKTGKYGRLSRCKVCHETMKSTPESKAKNAEHSKAWQQSHPEWYARRHRRVTYGLSQEQFDELQAKQEGACAICHKPFTKRICVDHDHETGAVRGLLCNPCNSGIGNLQDSIENLEAAIRYLRSHRP